MRGISTGIDIGTSAVTTVVVQRDKSGNARLAGIGRAASDGVRRGAVVDPQRLSRSILKSVAEAAKMSGASLSTAAVAFSGSHIRSAVSRGVVAIARADGEITKDDVGRSIQAAEALYPKNANREIIHISPREFWVDGEGGIADPVGMVGMRLETEVLIIEGEKRFLQNLVRAFDEAGIAIWDWMFSALSASRVTLTTEERELGAVLLDIGAGISDYAIWKEGVLTDAGVIPVGGELVTHDIAVMLKTKVDAAEAIKRKFGHVAPDLFSKHNMIKLAEFVPDDTDTYSQKELGEVVMARMADIFEPLGLVLRRGGRQPLLPAGLVLIGGAAELPGLREFAKKEMRLPAERGRIYGIDLNGFDAHAAYLASALGAALWHLEESGGLAGRAIGFPPHKVWPFLKNWLKVFLP